MTHDELLKEIEELASHGAHRVDIEAWLGLVPKSLTRREEYREAFLRGDRKWKMAPSAACAREMFRIQQKQKRGIPCLPAELSFMCAQQRQRNEAKCVAGRVALMARRKKIADLEIQQLQAQLNGESTSIAIEGEEGWE